MANYTEEETKELINLYKEYGNDGIDTIAKAINKTKKSVIAKLSREKVYTVEEKQKSPYKKMTKKVIINKLCELTNLELKGIEPASVGSLKELLEFIDDNCIRKS